MHPIIKNARSHDFFCFLTLSCMCVHVWVSEGEAEDGTGEMWRLGGGVITLNKNGNSNCNNMENSSCKKWINSFKLRSKGSVVSREGGHIWVWSQYLSLLFSLRSSMRFFILLNFVAWFVMTPPFDSGSPRKTELTPNKNWTCTNVTADEVGDKINADRGVQVGSETFGLQPHEMFKIYGH